LLLLAFQLQTALLFGALLLLVLLHPLFVLFPARSILILVLFDALLVLLPTLLLVLLVLLNALAVLLPTLFLLGALALLHLLLSRTLRLALLLFGSALGFTLLLFGGALGFTLLLFSGALLGRLLLFLILRVPASFALGSTLILILIVRLLIFLAALLPTTTAATLRVGDAVRADQDGEGERRCCEAFVINFHQYSPLDNGGYGRLCLPDTPAPLFWQLLFQRGKEGVISELRD
jgi:hypothetical protein